MYLNCSCIKTRLSIYAYLYTHTDLNYPYEAHLCKHINH